MLTNEQVEDVRRRLLQSPTKSVRKLVSQTRL